jgi:hypothetical protein
MRDRNLRVHTVFIYCRIYLIISQLLWHVVVPKLLCHRIKITIKCIDIESPIGSANKNSSKRENTTNNLPRFACLLILFYLAEMEAHQRKDDSKI